MASLARQIARLQRQLLDAHDERDRLIAAGLTQIDTLRKQEEDLLVLLHRERQANTQLRIDLQIERSSRIAAQRARLDQLRSPCVACNGKFWTGEIGYDPDTDPKVIQEIAEGKVPPRADLKEIAEEVIAARNGHGPTVAQAMKEADDPPMVEEQCT